MNNPYYPAGYREPEVINFTDRDIEILAEHFGMTWEEVDDRLTYDGNFVNGCVEFLYTYYEPSYL